MAGFQNLGFKSAVEDFIVLSVKHNYPSRRFGAYVIEHFIICMIASLMTINYIRFHIPMSHSNLFYSSISASAIVLPWTEDMAVMIFQGDGSCEIHSRTAKGVGSKRNFDVLALF
jgi:hypothetical protein